MVRTNEWIRAGELWGEKKYVIFEESLKMCRLRPKAFTGRVNQWRVRIIISPKYEKLHDNEEKKPIEIHVNYKAVGCLNDTLHECTI